MTKAPQPKPGDPPMNRLPIYDHEGNMRGHVGKTATQATVSRFLGRHGATLGRKNGRAAWLGPKPPPAPPPKPMAKPDVAAAGDPSASKASQTLEISLKAAKGSASKDNKGGVS